MKTFNMYRKLQTDKKLNVKEYLDLNDLPTAFDFYGREDMIAKR